LYNKDRISFIKVLLRRTRSSSSLVIKGSKNVKLVITVKNVLAVQQLCCATLNVVLVTITVQINNNHALLIYNYLIYIVYHLWSPILGIDVINRSMMNTSVQIAFYNHIFLHNWIILAIDDISLPMIHSSYRLWP